MSTFAEFAAYYDLFYSDKDYAGEARFVEAILKRHGTAIRSILEFGCGTGGHAMQMAEIGYSVKGVDRSASMIARALLAASTLPANCKGNFTAQEGDVTQLHDVGIHDAVLSLFHVINYQTTNDALAGMFEAARKSLRPGGVFLFDFWYGPAVLADRPTSRMRRVHVGGEAITRFAEPVLHINRNTVDVNYTLLVADEARQTLREYSESHSMRYLFLPEIELLARSASFQVVESGTWMRPEPLSASSWLGWAVLQAL